MDVKDYYNNDIFVNVLSWFDEMYHISDENMVISIDKDENTKYILQYGERVEDFKTVLKHLTRESDELNEENVYELIKQHIGMEIETVQLGQYDEEYMLNIIPKRLFPLRFVEFVLNVRYILENRKSSLCEIIDNYFQISDDILDERNMLSRFEMYRYNAIFLQLFYNPLEFLSVQSEKEFTTDEDFVNLMINNNHICITSSIISKYINPNIEINPVSENEKGLTMMKTMIVLFDKFADEDEEMFSSSVWAEIDYEVEDYIDYVIEMNTQYNLFDLESSE